MQRKSAYLSDYLQVAFLHSYLHLQMLQKKKGEQCVYVVQRAIDFLKGIVFLNVRSSRLYVDNQDVLDDLTLAAFQRI